MKTTNETTTSRQFSNVNDWLKSKPSEEEIKKVLTLINRGSLKELRTELYKKEAELAKTSKFVLKMVEMGFNSTPEMTAKVDALVNEVKALKDLLPEPVKRVKKEKKEEVIETLETQEEVKFSEKVSPRIK